MSPKIIILAYNHRFAEAAARELQLSPHRWTYASCEDSLRGLRGYPEKIYMVQTPRYTPTSREREIREIQQIILAGQDLKTETVVLR